MMQVEAHFTRRLSIVITHTLECGHEVSQRREASATLRSNGDKVLCATCMTFRVIINGISTNA